MISVPWAVSNTANASSKLTASVTPETDSRFRPSSVSRWAIAGMISLPVVTILVSSPVVS